MTPLIRVGRWAYWTLTRRNGDELKVKVYLQDHREIFGRSEFLIHPAGGEGETWVNEDTLTGGKST